MCPAQPGLHSPLHGNTDLVPKGTPSTRGGIWFLGQVCHPLHFPHVNPMSTGCLGPYGPEVQRLPWGAPTPGLGLLAAGWEALRENGASGGSHHDKRVLTLQRWAGDGREAQDRPLWRPGSPSIVGAFSSALKAKPHSGCFPGRLEVRVTDRVKWGNRP